MKLTCVLIIVVLFLTACQLTTVGTSSRGKQKHRALRSTDKNSKMSKNCTKTDGACYHRNTCCSKSCNLTTKKCLAS
nr:conotoxin precursor O1 [Conus judaeus]UMA83808.1 conotoxin precursor O1 [Conus judaeus]DAZ86466.1 TPA_inf: conotoxin precursor O1 [Conus judaeus]DAZ86768.1 TPA_inf: conotoxin precursor O1 [Conus judaeus]